MNQPIQGMIPPGGWHYLDRDGVRVPLDGEAESYTKLLTLVMERRIANRMTVGDVKVDVDTYICGSFPSQCGNTQDQRPQQIPHGQQTRFIDLIAEALTKLHETPKVILSIDEARQRAQVCQDCPMNDRDWQNSCPTCVENARQLAHIINQGQSLGMRKLGACRIYNLPLDTMCLVRDHAKHHGVPSQCWNR